MPKLTRRNLLVLGGTGAAGLAVAGCGTEDDPRADGRDGEILGAAADAEALLGAIYDALDPGGEGKAAVEQFRDASSTRQDELDRLGAPQPDTSFDVQDTTAAATEAASQAITAYREGVRFLSTSELRATAIQFLTEVAAEQATLRGLDGEDQSPVPFVTGLTDKPYVASEDDDDAGDTSTTSTSSSTSTTSTTEEGG